MLGKLLNSETVHLYACKCHSCAHNPWLVIVFEIFDYLVIPMSDLDRFLPNTVTIGVMFKKWSTNVVPCPDR